MKKKLLSLVLVGVMTATMLTACGSKETTEAPVEEEVIVEETAETTEEPAEEVAEDTSDEDTTLGYVKEDMSEEETKEANTEEFNQDVAMKKVERAIDCYRKLVETEDEATWNMIDSIECGGAYKYYLDLTTSDGIPVYDENSNGIGYVTLAAMGNMYYDYTNGIINEVTPMSEYIPSQTNNEIINKYNFNYSENSDEDLMWSFIAVANYLNRAETIEAGDFIKLDTPAFVVNGTMNAVYKMPLIVDGEDSRLYAAFDENGNMINTGNESDVDVNKVLIKTFPEQ
ncbi:MAG: hypothetical protein Q4E29_08440 [Lachnospiraceae bacterium]|nr:hypothetical protein [Lachnospiraceae bacterium]